MTGQSNVGSVKSTMQDEQLSLVTLLRHGARVYPTSEVVTFDGTSTSSVTYAQTSERAGKLARGLAALGIGSGDRVATFASNTQAHLDAYFAVPAMGAVLHTLNVRLHPEQLAFVVNHAEDKVILVDGALVPVLAEAAPAFRTAEHFVVIGDGDHDGLSPTLGYDDLLASADDGPEPWQIVDERSAALLCYTTGTTGLPRGVAYSHRSIFLHSLMLCSANLYGFNELDRLLVSIPMFHGMAMGVPYAGWMVGADLILPGRHLQPNALARLIAAERPSWAGAVPVIWNDVLRYSEEQSVDLSSLRVLACGGSAVPREFIETFEKRLGVRIVQGWGMTETNPVAAVNARCPKGASAEEERDWLTRSGRLVPGVDARVVDEDGAELPWDGVATGELEVRGPWVTGQYFRDDAVDRFHDGWLRTGDVGVIHPKGFIRIKDRVKDVIKSGGEWISSVALESELLRHPAVVDAAVIAHADERWQERPLACVVFRDGVIAAPNELRAYLRGRVARWWVPEYWASVAELPRTSVGKIDKKSLREAAQKGQLPITKDESWPGE
jgi:fatty-acyl-CoA synthase